LLGYKFDEQNNGTAKTVTNPTVRCEEGRREKRMMNIRILGTNEKGRKWFRIR
jgi:hypothetical protein